METYGQCETADRAVAVEHDFIPQRQAKIGKSTLCLNDRNKPFNGSISFGMHRARRVADMGQSPALKPAPKIRGCGIFVPGCRCFSLFFSRACTSSFGC